jgi:hypothetical protein
LSSLNWLRKRWQNFAQLLKLGKLKMKPRFEKFLSIIPCYTIILSHSANPNAIHKKQPWCFTVLYITWFDALIITLFLNSFAFTESLWNAYQMYLYRVPFFVHSWSD